MPEITRLEKLIERLNEVLDKEAIAQGVKPEDLPPQVPRDE